MTDVTHFKLSNGIRVVHQHMPHTKIVHCGIFLDIGSRDESDSNQGIAHFWEHMAFKGTKHRKSFHILNSLDSVGGELNAFTDKEKIAFYASIRDVYAERAIDILSDITFHSVFPENQIERERGVILEEMSMYYDDPDDSLQDEFEAIIYQGHPLGMNILGRKETVKGFRKKDFIEFKNHHFDTGKIVFSFVGNIPADKVNALALKYLNIPIARKANTRRKKFKVYKPSEKILQRPVKQARCGIGRDAYPMFHENRIPFYMLVNILGGPGMNSRLNMALREKHGFVYSIDAHYVPYTDTGMFAVFFGTEPHQIDRCISLVKKEMGKLLDQPLSTRQLVAAKEQIKGQLAMAEENNQNLMMMMGRSLLDLGRVPTLEEIFEKVQRVDAAKLLSVAEEMLDERQYSVMIMTP